MKINKTPPNHCQCYGDWSSLNSYIVCLFPTHPLGWTGRRAANFKITFPSFLPHPPLLPWVFVLCPKSVLFFSLLSSGSQEYWLRLKEITSYYGNNFLLRQLTTYVSACTHSLDCYAILGHREDLDAVFMLFFKISCAVEKKAKLAIFHFCKIMRIKEYFFPSQDLTRLWKLPVNSQWDLDIVKPEQSLKSKSKI